MAGWIKLHRGLTDWEWYSDANTSRVFIHCLIKANHKDKSWKGKAVLRGTFISSFDKLAADLGLTRQKIRTAIANLKSTNDLTIETFTQHTVFKVNNYSEYQDETSDSTNEQPTIQPTDNQRITTTKNVKNIRMEEVSNKPTSAAPDWMGDCLDAFWKTYPKKVDKKKSIERLTKMIKANPDRDHFGMILSAIKAKALVDDKQFFPALDRYLRDEKWTDEIIPRGESYGAERPRKSSSAERSERDIARALALIEADENNHGPMETDGSVISTQVGSGGGGDNGSGGLDAQLFELG